MDWWLIKFFEMSPNHKKLLRFSVPKLGAALTVESRVWQAGAEGCWWHRGWLGCRAASLLSHSLQQAGSWQLQQLRLRL